MGMTPSDASRVSVPKAEANEFDDIITGPRTGPRKGK
jgi:hypothetical protein